MFLRVAVPVPTLDLLTYSVPAAMAAPVEGACGRAARLCAVTGIVVAVESALPSDVDAAAVKPIRTVLDTEPFLPADVVRLARWTAEYYAAGVGTTITAVLPPKTRGARADAHKTRRIAAITAAGLDGLERGSARQREALALLNASAPGVPTTVLTKQGSAPRRSPHGA